MRDEVAFFHGRWQDIYIEFGLENRHGPGKNRLAIMRKPIVVDECNFGELRGICHAFVLIVKI